MGKAQLTDLPKRLLRLGFPVDAARVYAHLVTIGPVTEQEAVRTGDSRLVREGLRWLYRQRLIAFRHAAGRRIVYAVDPGLAITALVTDLVWQHMKTLADVDALPSTEDPHVEEIRSIASSVLADLAGVYQPTDAVRGSRTTVVSDSYALAILSVEAVRLAKREVRAASRRPRLPDVAFFWNAIHEAMRSGVIYRRITDLHELVEHGLAVVERDTRTSGVRLQVIEANRIRCGFYVVDHRYAVVHDPSPDSVTPPRGGRMTSNAHEVQRRLREWDRLSKAAMPSDFVLARLRESAHRLMLEARHEDRQVCSWLERLVEYGKFTDPPADPDVVRRAARARLVRRNYTGHPLPAYDVDESALRLTYEGS
jgi:hypothetical protein